MNCPNCNRPVEAGAVFCGNCGQTLQAPVQPQAPVVQPVVQPIAPTAAVMQPAPAPIQQPVAASPAPAPAPAAFAGAPGGTVPAYALSSPAQHSGETKALLSLIIGIISIFAGLAPIIGIIFAVTGIVLGTMSHNSRKRGLSTAGIILSCLGLFVSLAIFAFALTHQDSLKGARSSRKDPALSGTTSTASSASTPCYKVSFATSLTIKNTSGSCDMSAFNGATLDESNDAYKIYGTKSSTLNATNFQDFAKKALEQDVQSNLAGFKIVSQGAGTFSNSQAYVISTKEASSGIAVVEAAVLHPTANGDNVFIFAHAGQDNASLSTLESNWEWK